MTVNKIDYKSKPAYSIENDCMKTIFLEQGAKMVSLYDKSAKRELLIQSRADTLRQHVYGSGYNETDVCGFDDMFPNIDECYYERYPWDGIKMPDHGEVWSIGWKYENNNDCVVMKANGVRFPYLLSKKIMFTQVNVLSIEYELANNSSFEFDCLWAAHVMLQLDGDEKFSFPQEKNLFVTYSRDGILGNYGKRISLADFFTKSDYLNFFSAEINAGCYMEKFYCTERLNKNVLSVFYPSSERLYTFETSADTVPYLGLLVSKGCHIGNCMIIEPCTAPLDRPDRARAFGAECVLPPYGKKIWTLKISMQEKK
ncbi:MAG: hypothetical protein FWE82_08870 [Defluviitaleaceae bacterium]|nr:hypothetical protein [Defluviitaleaceae bacterium]